MVDYCDGTSGGQGVAPLDNGNQKAHRRNVRGATPQAVQLNREICAAAGRGDARALAKVVKNRAGQMNLINLCTAMHRYAKIVAWSWNNLDADAVQFPKDLVQSIKTKLLLEDRPPPQCLSNIAWSAAKLQYNDPELLRMLKDVVLEELDQFKEFELANLLWGFAKLQAGDEVLFTRSQEFILLNLDQFNAASLSTIAWAFTTVPCPPTCTQFLNQLFSAYVVRLQSPNELATITPVSITNMLWALATAAVYTKREPLRVICRAVVANLGSFKSHELAITLWALAHQGFFFDPVYSEVARHIVSSSALMGSFHAQGISNLLWAYAKQKLVVHQNYAGHLTGDQLSKLLAVALSLIPRAGPIELAALLWAVTELVESSGRHPVADSIWLAAAIASSERDPFACSTKTSSARLRKVHNAYVKFFSAEPQACVPEICRMFSVRLESLLENAGDGALAEAPRRLSQSNFHSVPARASVQRRMKAPDRLPASKFHSDSFEKKPQDGAQTESAPDIMAAAPISLPPSLGGWTSEACLYQSASIAGAQSHEFAEGSQLASIILRGCQETALLPFIAGQLEPAYVSVIPETDDLEAPPVLTVVEEFMEFDNEFSSASAENTTQVVLEVFRAKAWSNIGVEAHICDDGGNPEAISFYVRGISKTNNLISLTFPAREGRWKLFLTPHDLSCGTAGATTALEFVGRHSVKAIATFARKSTDGDSYTEPTRASDTEALEPFDFGSDTSSLSPGLPECVAL